MNEPQAPESWRKIRTRCRDRWFMGVDLGQSNDPTAICVLHHTVVNAPGWVPNDSARTWTENHSERFNVLHLERLPLGMAYPMQVNRVAAMLQRPPLDRAACKLVIDDTGVGRAVGDMFEGSGLRPNRITITSGLESSQHGSNTFHVPKALLISTLEARSHSGELKIAAEITDAGALAEELKDFERSISAAGRSTYNAREGKHDDLILSVAIALWMATSGPKTIVEPFSV